MLRLTPILLLAACAKTVPTPAAVEGRARAEAASAQASAEQTATELENDVEAAADPLRAAVDNPLRPAEERARDAYRHPYETLSFFEIEPDDRVLELWAGGGWYTHILAPYLAPAGKLYVTSYADDAEPSYRGESAVKMRTWLGESGLDEAVGILVVDGDAPEFAVDEPVDAVLTFRNAHNWLEAGIDTAIYEQAFAALKPGGTLGVVDHRADPGTSAEVTAETGYIDQDTLVATIEAVGFELVATSEVNANPADDHDHPEGVWTLLPRLRLGEVDRDVYTAIGESDRFTLKFVKPE